MGGIVDWSTLWGFTVVTPMDNDDYMTKAILASRERYKARLRAKDEERRAAAAERRLNRQLQAAWKPVQQPN